MHEHREGLLQKIRRDMDVEASASTTQTMGEPMSTFPKEGFARLPAVLEFLKISKTAFYNGIRNGTFPKPRKLTPKTSVWNAEDIRRLLSEDKPGGLPPENRR